MADPRRTESFDYDLPPEAIAQTPMEPRDAARLLVDLAGPHGDPGSERAVAHHTVADLPDLLRPGDLVVVNDTKVLAARLNLRKPTGGAVEVLLLEATAVPGRWEALVRPSKRVAPGTTLELHGRPLVTVGEVLPDGRRAVEVAADAVELAGEIPLPPYIGEPLTDPDRYQTVFARHLGSVAAPTAGLHLTEAVIAGLADRGIGLATVELQVGLGTFRPISTERIDEHDMHGERYAVTAETWARIEQAERVVAVGTTVVRTLESVARTGELSARTELFIRRGFHWRVVDVLLTNFHVPRSSLLVLVDAFIGDRWRTLYSEAQRAGYRFLSFGDAMLLTRR